MSSALEKMRVYSLGPLAGGGGTGGPAGKRNACVALLMTGDRATDGGAAEATGGGASGFSAGIPNIWVKSPARPAGAAGGAGGAAPGKAEAEGISGPCGVPGGGALKNCVKLPPSGEAFAGVGLALAAGDRNMLVNAPGSCGLGGGGGQSPGAGFCGSADWNRPVNSLGAPAGGVVCGGGAAGICPVEADTGALKILVNSPGSGEAGAETTGGGASGSSGSGAAAICPVGADTGARNILVNSPGSGEAGAGEADSGEAGGAEATSSGTSNGLVAGAGICPVKAANGA